MATAKYKKNKRGEFEARIWDGTYNADGSKHRAYLVSKKSSADLERKVADLKRKVKEGSVPQSNITFGEYSRRWLEVYKAGKEKNTQRMYRTSVTTYLAFLDNIPMSDLRQFHIQQAINMHLDHPRTCKDIKSTASQIIRAAIRDRILPRVASEDLLEGITLPRYVKAARRALTAAETQAFFNVRLDARKDSFLSTLYYTGVRKGEALGLRSEDFDWDKMTVSISRVVIFDGNRPEIKPYPKSERGTRLIPLPAEIIPRVRPYTESQDGFLWHTKTCELMTDTGYDKFWKSIVRALNLVASTPIEGLTAHIFRHNYCTLLCYQVPMLSTKMIAQILGDDERMVLDVYSHILAEKEDVAGAISAAFAR